MSQCKHHTARCQFRNGVHDSPDLRRGRDDPDARDTSRVRFGVIVVLVLGGQPIFGLQEILLPVHVFERLETLAGRTEESGGVCTALGWLEERSFSVPSKNRGAPGQAHWPEEAKKFRIKNFFLSLGLEG